MKKLVYIMVVAIVFLSVTGCIKKEENISGNLTDLMQQVYEGVPSSSIPKLVQTEVTDDNEVYYLGTTELQYEEALASEPVMSSIAHSVVLIRMKNGKEAEEAVKLVKESVDPRKWVCVEVEEKNVFVERRGNLVILIMDNEFASLIHDNFFQL